MPTHKRKHNEKSLKVDRLDITPLRGRRHDMDEEEFSDAVNVYVRRLYFTAFRHGFFSCMCGVLIYYTMFA